jgi:hypothetical protein
MLWLRCVLPAFSMATLPANHLAAIVLPLRLRRI